VRSSAPRLAHQRGWPGHRLSIRRVRECFSATRPRRTVAMMAWPPDSALAAAQPDRAAFVSDTQHLTGLNSAQRAAVTHIDGPLLILAGAGTGKTKTLVHRIAHLIRSGGVPPSRILAVTFTNRAAEEMRERVHAYVGAEARAITLGTFHALGVRILREHGARLGLPQRFAIYATGDQLAALRSATSEISIADDRFALKRILWRISDWKSKRIDPAQARTLVAGEQATGTRADDYAVLAADAYPRYEETLRAAGAVDFDDLLLLPVRLLEQDEEVRRALWKRWHHVMIDEYQDTNSVQFHLARLLAGTRRNLCVVGDDDQSIYAFRGADVGNILEFERHFPGTKVVTLEENYRSTARILGAANAIIAGNRHRHPKRLRSTAGIGAPVTLREFDDEQMEAEGVADEITRRRLLHRMKWGDIAVLYRANARSEEHTSELQSRENLVCRPPSPPRSPLFPYTTLFRSIIAGNRHRHPKRLRSTAGIGAPVTLREFDDEQMEAEGVADEITRRRLLHRMKWGDIAVLYRANAQSRPLEEAFRRKNIPYRVIGGVSFFERKEAADATAYLRAVAWPHDEVSVRRIINYPARGIGRQTVLRIADLARERKATFSGVLAQAGPADVGAAAARAIAGFLSLLDNARASLAQAEAAAAARPRQAGEQTPLAAWAEQLFERVGLEDALRIEHRDPRQAQVRVDNLRDLIGAITRYERRIWAEKLG